MTKKEMLYNEMIVENEKQEMLEMQEMQEMLDQEREEGFYTGIAFTVFTILAAFISWAIVFAPMGWWL